MFLEDNAVDQTQRQAHPVGSPNLRLDFQNPISYPNETIAYHARIGQEGVIPDRFVSGDLINRRKGSEEANHTTIGGDGPA